MSRDSDLQPFTRALAGMLAEQCEPPPPDLGDVLARAQAKSDDPLPESLRDGLALFGDEDEEERIDDALDAFAADLRECYEDELRDRELAPIPRPRAAGSRWLPYVTAAAAVALLVLGLGAGQWSTRAVEVGPESRSEAQRMHDARRGQVSADTPTPLQVEPPSPRRATPHETDAPELAPEPEVEEIEAPEEPTPEVTHRRATDRPSLDDLEAQARAAWQRGDLVEAERLFRRVIQRAKRGPRAELAYGDLFSVAKQRAGAAGQVAVWREYLRRFPAGRFADGARAGLCRRATGDAQRECWIDYLEHHPRGAHAEQARRRVPAEEP